MQQQLKLGVSLIKELLFQERDSVQMAYISAVEA